MMRLTLLLSLLVPALAPDDRTLVLQLGDASPSVRENASAALEARGDAALPELRRALDHTDPEIRCRAEALVDLRTQERTFARLCREQRASRLRLAELLLEYDYPPGQVVDVEGARFTFTRRPWAPDGEIRGTIFETEAARAPGVTVHWSVASIRDGSELPIETCAWHSPRLVYVPARVPDRAEVRIRGVRRWTCDVPIRFVSPSEGQIRRFAGYTVTICWPDIVVRSERPLEQSAMDAVLRDKDVRCKIRPGREDGMFIGFGMGCGGHSRCYAKIEDRAWCGCRGAPMPGPCEPEPTSRETQARPREVERYDLDAIESIDLTLHLPVEEPFEIVSPPLE